MSSIHMRNGRSQPRRQLYLSRPPRQPIKSSFQITKSLLRRNQPIPALKRVSDVAPPRPLDQAFSLFLSFTIPTLVTTRPTKRYDPAPFIGCSGLNLGRYHGLPCGSYGPGLSRRLQSARKPTQHREPGPIRSYNLRPRYIQGRSAFLKETVSAEVEARGGFPGQ